VSSVGRPQTGSKPEALHEGPGVLAMTLSYHAAGKVSNCTRACQLGRSCELLRTCYKTL